jgi:hypothetical protein
LQVISAQFGRDEIVLGLMASSVADLQRAFIAILPVLPSLSKWPAPVGQQVEGR